MGILAFICPATGQKVSTGLETDPDSFASLPNGVSEVHCPYCSEPHLLSDIWAWLSERDYLTEPSTDTGTSMVPRWDEWPSRVPLASDPRNRGAQTGRYVCWRPNYP